ncbi:ZIP family metal transporter [Deinococcus sp. Marseille-Q6407]|uniref:ZIP family metal transporter n=1 Tax=Deinococcus sp. Marseille-Q6407 TaxID=2969223 RepID=UPI0021C0367C|nr:ZIP family metal transporter [Deinococcus sp. Marseille-Q6407]
MDGLFSFFQQLSPPQQALGATIFTWSLTALGASLVLFTRSVSPRLLSAAQGLAAGVMLAASFWSLLNPAIEMAGNQGMVPWVPAAVGLLLGAGFVGGLDKLLPHLHPGFAREQAEGVPVRWSQGALLLAAMTIHNLPEGMAVDVSFGGPARAQREPRWAARWPWRWGSVFRTFQKGWRWPCRCTRPASRAGGRSCSGRRRRWWSRSGATWVRCSW